ncbi:hypothetical protein [Kosakonia pseudosacchari]|uniref:Uncharacterized protein n=1 Tax=Kosakonia pseudosacchari TaxID=1646340 RepID=A0ABX4ILN0_9ENTR|nr:hypothetical protein [Kosakonia pseudosacchari]PDO83351.1 hypothetical protein BK796_20470 [Kosakonia pseudosacchari]
MRIAILFLVALWAFSATAEQCYPEFSESGFLASIGKKPVKKTEKKEEGITRYQYEFRKDLPAEDALSDDADKKYEPQFYLTIYEPPCAKKVTIWFYKDNGNTEKLSNVTLAGRAYKYLTGVEPAIFANKMKRFNDVQNFESFDDKADSKFIKSGDVFSIEVTLK